jgi:anaerobic dimethyl sulfoxide reductase subunit A
MIQRIPTFCGKDCGGNACPLVALVDDGVITGMEHNPAGADLKPCPRGYMLHHAHSASDRLLSPLIASGPRGSGSFRAASWDEALGLVATRLKEVRARHGPDSIIGLGSAGSSGALHDSQNLLTRFLNATGGATTLTGNYSNGAARFVLPYLFGDAYRRSGWDANTVRHSRLVVLWGANILEARLGAELGTAVTRAARAGVPVIVIDPRRSRTAGALGARWIPIRPGTDAAMMLAVLHVLFRDGLVDLARASALATGLDDLERYISGAADGTVRSPAWAEPICGVPAATIESFAKEYSATRPTMLVPGYSIQRVLNGEETFRLSVALQIATGNFGIAGGSSGSLNNRLPSPLLGSHPDLADSLPPESRPSVPVLRWPDAVLEGRAGGYPGDITAAYVAGFNAVNQGADSRKSERALKALEFSVCNEMFMTPTARLCDVVLPVLSPLEKEDICAPWHGNYLLYKRAAVPPRGLARSDWDIFSDLAERLGAGVAFTGGRSAMAWLNQFLAESDIQDTATFKESGVYFGTDRERVGLADFAANPAANPLSTPSGKVELRSDDYAHDTGRAAIPGWTDPPADVRFPLLLITPKTIRRTHSQGGGGVPWTYKSRLDGDEAHVARVVHEAGIRPDSGQLTVSSTDAANLGLANGDTCFIENDSGAVQAVVLISGDIATGVVCLHEGAWLAGSAEGVDYGGCANMLTSTEGTGPARAPVMHGIPVAIRKVVLA